MKKVTAIACLLASLLPAWGKAEEAFVPTTRGWICPSSSGDENQFWRAPLMSEIKVSDEDLMKVVGHGLETPLPWELIFSRKQETAPRIKLWDEADRGAVNNGNPADQGIFQRITLSTIERR